MEGTWFVLPTAFDESGALDRASQRRLVEAVVSWGVDGLVTMGVMSEAHALTEDERGEVIAAVSGAAGGVPVVVGCSGSSPEVVAARARIAERAGARAALVSAPPMIADPETLPTFFERVAPALDLPIVVQDEPAATGTTMPVPTLLRCVDAAHAIAVKLEDPPTPAKIERLLAQRPDIGVFGGLGGLYALDELRRGARGTMTGFSFPEILARVRTLLVEGDSDAAARTFDRHLPLIAFEAQRGVGLAIRKELLRRRGALAVAATRSAPALTPRTLEDLDDVLRRVGISPSLERLEVEVS